jgi:hypothetical protein
MLLVCIKSCRVNEFDGSGCGCGWMGGWLLNLGSVCVAAFLLLIVPNKLKKKSKLKKNKSFNGCLEWL